MKDKELKFKTNLNCSGCVSKVASDLDMAKGICHWNVDIDDKNKTLTVKSEGITKEKVESIIQSKGFKIASV